MLNVLSDRYVNIIKVQMSHLHLRSLYCGNEPFTVLLGDQDLGH